jgi:hypothetical protein
MWPSTVTRCPPTPRTVTPVTRTRQDMTGEVTGSTDASSEHVLVSRCYLTGGYQHRTWRARQGAWTLPMLPHGYVGPAKGWIRLAAPIAPALAQPETRQAGHEIQL